MEQPTPNVAFACCAFKYDYIQYTYNASIKALDQLTSTDPSNNYEMPCNMKMYIYQA